MDVEGSVYGLIKVLSGKLPGGTEEIQETPQSEWSVTRKEI